MKKIRKQVGNAGMGILLALFFLTACASSLRESDRGPEGPSTGTTVLFVVDGLSAKNLRRGLARARAPNIREHFLGNADRFPLARAEFPTLTYPNLASILTGQRIGEQPIIANHMVVEKGEVLDFESPHDHGELQRQVDPRSVFDRLRAAGRRTASFSYVLGMNADDHTSVGLNEGLGYATHDYRSLDGRLLDLLSDYLTADGRPAAWPEFIYVHLVGVDGTAHRYGDASAENAAYLAWLDARLGKILRLLRNAEGKGHAVITVLTADHGFQDPVFVSDAASVFKEPGIIVTNESRYLGVHGRGRPAASLRPLLKRARELASVEFTALRDGDDLYLNYQNQELRFRYGPRVCADEAYSLSSVVQNVAGAPACPSDFDGNVPPYPYFIANVATYLRAPYHPDGLVIAKPRYSFLRGKGAHGGPTAEEILVPLLLRGARIDGKRPIRSGDILKILE